MKLTVEMMDPIPVGDGPLEKFTHHHKVGDRVVLKEGRRPGKISNLDDHNRVHIQLDSGHSVQCAPDECEPEDWQSEKTSAKASGFAKARNPFPIDDEPSAAPAKPSATALELLGPFLKASDGGLKRALADGKVSVADRVLIKRCLDNIQNGRTVTDPFAGVSDYEDENFRNLRVMAEKYAGSEEGGSFSKATRRSKEHLSFHPGQDVKTSSGRGTVHHVGEYAPFCIGVTLPNGNLGEFLPEDVEAAY